MIRKIVKHLHKVGRNNYSNYIVKIRSIHYNPVLRQTMKKVDSEDSADVIFQDVGNKGVITLNRPKALNALNLSMVHKIYPTLEKWSNSKSLVLIEGAGEKAFCAGGDVKSIVLALRENNGEIPGQEFFRAEYSMNHLIGTYKKPYIALMNGITMGGGVGLSVHGKYRVATEKTLFAMPETAIGLFPDVGGSYFLPRLNRSLGFFLGLSGYRLKGIDVLLAGIATHYVPSENLGKLKEELLTTENPNIEMILNKHQRVESDKFSLEPHMQNIEDCFSAPSMEEIIEKLKSNNSTWAKDTLGMLVKMSPTSLKITHKALCNGRNSTLSECLQIEFRLACRALRKDSDFAEGVRALLIDKDNQPKWNPRTLEEVNQQDVDKNFLPFETLKELQLSNAQRSRL